ncbi:FxLYD domain-containing protein [Streptomyces sp. NPDC058231]|uniref:FxLYD domain-containing protein n=1 Tax=Streptomyces sp. NPDC058231 TaxID=3346392 RepID=UPI0036E33C5D
MTSRSVRGIAAGLLTAAVASAATGCSDDGGKVSSTVSGAASAAASAASRGSDVMASATAAAQEKLDGFKNGVNAKKDVKVGAVANNNDGRAVATITVTNITDSAKSYMVQVNFRDGSGNLLDTAVVTVDDVEPRTPKKATARSNRSLGGDITADVGRALRH